MVTEVDGRKKQILKAIIHEHILTAEPVGSRTLSKTYKLGISSATIRNEMSDLEELGFLKQPHTSAGRVPSDKGYRFYVDNLMKEKNKLTVNLKQFLKELKYEKQGIQDIMSQMARMLSQVTRYTTIISEPRVQESKVRRVQLLQVDKHSLLIVLITDAGVVHNKVIKLEKAINSKQINYLNEYLTNYLKDKKLSELDKKYLMALELKLIKRLDLSHDLFELFYQGINLLRKPDELKIYLGGTTYILEQPEFNDLESLKKVLNVFEQEEVLRELLYKMPNKDLQVRIGQENEIEEMKKCSIVFATYNIDDKACGKIGVIGPTRMEYSRVIASVNTTANLIGRIISNLSG
ncbi:MAG TPA: heat-inducible transcriptional repressor HrcA [Halanaerobiales bacterium]|nr:heat-inducible transcriptional repressor HrcA [Halanaerobiales bacterium]